MTTIQIHVPSLFIGYFIGVFITALIVCYGLYDQRWSLGFLEGYQEGVAHQRMKNEIEE